MVPLIMSQQNAQQQDNSLAALWIMAMAFLVIVVIWYTLHAQVAAFILTVRLWELEVLNLLTSANHKIIVQVKQELIDPARITPRELLSLSTTVGQEMRWLFSPVMFILAFLIFISNAKMRFMTVFSMQHLLDTEKENWPQITPISQVDLIKLHIEEGKWAMAETPMAFCKKNKLLVEEQEGGHFDPRVKVTATLIKEKARSVFTMQLGEPWRGVGAMPIYMRALFAVFAARIHGERETALKLLNQIAKSTESGKLNFEGVDQLVKRLSNHKIIQRVIHSHAYEYGVMASMLEQARNDGVLASADFLWLKPLDRRLWFMLNTVGRQTAPTEVGGPFAHWLAEKVMGRRLNVPMIDEAVNALEESLSLIVYKPDD